MKCDNCIHNRVCDGIKQRHHLLCFNFADRDSTVILPWSIGDTVYVVGTRCFAGEDPFNDCCLVECEECGFDEEYVVFEKTLTKRLIADLIWGDNERFKWNTTVFRTEEEAVRALKEVINDM